MPEKRINVKGKPLLEAPKVDPFEWAKPSPEDIRCMREPLGTDDPGSSDYIEKTVCLVCLKEYGLINDLGDRDRKNIDFLLEEAQHSDNVAFVGMVFLWMKKLDIPMEVSHPKRRELKALAKGSSPDFKHYLQAMGERVVLSDNDWDAMGVEAHRWRKPGRMREYLEHVSHLEKLGRTQQINDNDWKLIREDLEMHRKNRDVQKVAEMLVSLKDLIPKVEAQQQNIPDVKKIP
jgi:hypothetical protein